MILIIVVHVFNPRTREDYKIGGDSSQAHSEVLGDRIVIFGLRSRSRYIYYAPPTTKTQNIVEEEN